MAWLARHGVAALCAVFALGWSAASADQPFYAGKRLTLLINFAAGGPADVEGRLFAKYIGRHIAGAPGVLVQNMDGAGGIVGAKYLGAVAPRDGTVVGYFTGTGFIYALDPSRFDPDFRRYGFVAIQGGATVSYARSDVPPGLKTAADIVQARRRRRRRSLCRHLEGRAHAAGAGSARGEVQICYRIPLQRAGAAGVRERRDQRLFRIRHRAIAASWFPT